MKERIKLPGPVADIYRAVAELERLYPDRKFMPDGHLVGSIGEVIAREKFGLTMHSMFKPGHDGFDEPGGIQIKITAGSAVGVRADCARLFVLKITPPEDAEIIYGAPAINHTSRAVTSAKTNSRRNRCKSVTG
jgi:hypothetical protein